MKKIILATSVSLALQPFFAHTAYAYAYPSSLFEGRDEIYYTFTFNMDGDAGDEPNGHPDAGDTALCDVDNCYDTRTRQCYFIQGIPAPGTTLCEEACWEYYNSAVVYRGIIPIACGCKKVTSVEWRAHTESRERKYTTTNTDCEGNKTTTATNEYRCAAGYYGNGTTCTRCPGQKNTAGTTVYGNSPAGATALSQCALPVGTYTDETGTFTISSPCYHD